MLKRNITYTDFDGNEVTEQFCFHLSKAELIEMEVKFEGGLSAHLQRIVETEDGGQIIAAFKGLILDSYGVKSEDGKRFIKNGTLRDEFQETEAYSALFLELATDAGAAAEFVNGIMPAGLEADVARIEAQTKKNGLATETEVTEITKAKTISRADAVKLPAEELQEKLAGGYSIVE